MKDKWLELSALCFLLFGLVWFGIAMYNAYRVSELAVQLLDAQAQIERLKHDTGCRVDYSIDGEHWTQGTEFPCYPYMRVERFK